jgi:hypothetical protein
MSQRPNGSNFIKCAWPIIKRGCAVLVVPFFKTTHSREEARHDGDDSSGTDLKHARPHKFQVSS